MSAPQPEEVPRGEEPERLRADVQELARVLRSGMTGVYSWNGVKTMVGRKLDALDALLAEVERLAGERDEWERRFNNERRLNVEVRAKLAEMTAAYKWEAEDRELLAGRVAALEAALRAIAANAEAWHGPVNGDNRHARALLIIARWAKDPSSIPAGIAALHVGGSE